MVVVSDMIITVTVVGTTVVMVTVAMMLTAAASAAHASMSKSKRYISALIARKMSDFQERVERMKTMIDDREESSKFKIDQIYYLCYIAIKIFH